MEIGSSATRYPKRTSGTIQLKSADTPSRSPMIVCVSGKISKMMRKKSGNLSKGKKVPDKNDIGVMIKLVIFAMSACESTSIPTIIPTVEKT